MVVLATSTTGDHDAGGEREAGVELTKDRRVAFRLTVPLTPEELAGCRAEVRQDLVLGRAATYDIPHASAFWFIHRKLQPRVRCSRGSS